MIMLILPFTPPNSFFPPKEALARRKEKLRKSTSLSLAISLLVLVKMRWVVRPVLLFSLVFISRDGSQSRRGVLSQQKSRCERTKLLGHLHLWLLDRDLSACLSRRGPNHNLWICCWRVHYQSIINLLVLKGSSHPNYSPNLSWLLAWIQKVLVPMLPLRSISIPFLRGNMPSRTISSALSLLRLAWL